VATRHHALGLRAHTAAPEQEPGEGESAPAAVKTEAADPGSPGGPIAEEPRTPDIGHTNMCICENVKPDPLMLECGHCGREEHAACYRILQEDQLPARHCCAPCGQEEGRACTDPKTARMVKNHQGNAAPTCLFRRVLAALAFEQIVSSAWIRQRFGLDREQAEQVLGKLEEIEVLNRTDVGELAVDHQDKMLQARRKYLGVQTAVQGSTKAPLVCHPGAAGDIPVGEREGAEEGDRKSKRRKKSTAVANMDI
jgi:hypothetical protein